MTKKLAMMGIGLIACIWIVYEGASYLKAKQTEDVYARLQAQGYTISDIKDIQTRISNAPLLNTKVIFKDEPYVNYYYWSVNGEIQQGTSENTNPRSQADYDYKHDDQ